MIDEDTIRLLVSVEQSENYSVRQLASCTSLALFPVLISSYEHAPCTVLLGPSQAPWPVAS